jgi:hypothetical protein
MCLMIKKTIYIIPNIAANEDDLFSQLAALNFSQDQA